MPGDPALDGAAPVLLPGIEQNASEGYSSTNIQESGVDEPDFIKNDGQYVYALSGGYFLIYAATPPEEAREISRTEVGGYPDAMLVTEDTAVIFSVPSWELDLPYDIVEPGAYYGLKITILSVADKERPEILRELYVEGHYLTARQIDPIVHVVISSYLSFPALDFGDALPENVERIRASALESWIPTVLDVVHHGHDQEASTRPISACENFYLPQRKEIGPILTLLSLDLRNPLDPPQEVSIPSPAAIAYASTRSIYVSHADYAAGDYRPLTVLHKFDIGGDSGRAVYRASGEVEGWLLNPFSMGEKDEFLRVATTEERWDPEGSARLLSNHLFVLEEDGKDLRVTGQVRGIAPDERIYAARFLGDVGFMVTFEEIDPLFTFDLKDPANPRLVGELEVPGFSSYIHPADPDHLLTIGRDTDNAGGFAWFQGMQISLYDISDLADPKLTEMKILGTRGTESEALFDHKAFTYFRPKEILALPIELHEGGGGWPRYGVPSFVGFQVYGVDLSRGFSLLGQIDHEDLYAGHPDCSWKRMRRTLIIGNSIYTVSTAGIKVHALDDLSRAQSSIPFPECDGSAFPDRPVPEPFWF